MTPLADSSEASLSLSDSPSLTVLLTLLLKNLRMTYTRVRETDHYAKRTAVHE